MSKQLIRTDAQFTSLGQTVKMLLPLGASEVALRVYEPIQTVSIYVVADIPLTTAVYERDFMLLGTDDLPENFLKYIGTIPFHADPAAVVEAHIIEVQPATD